MRLAQKTALIVALFATANVAIGYLIHHTVVAPEFADLEHQEVEKNVKRALEAIQHEAQVLDLLAYDYASWDGTYEFMVSQDPGFYEKNLSPGALKTYGLHWMIVIDSSGDIISGPIHDFKSGELLRITELPQEHWDSSHPLLLGNTAIKPLLGIMSTNEGPILFTARDILNNFDEGPSRGRIIMGRRIDQEFISGIAERTRIDLAAWSTEDGSLDESVRIALLENDASDGLHAVVGEDESQLEVYTLVRDTWGAPALILRASIPRKITQRAAYINRLSLISYLIQGVVLAFLIMLPLHSAILAPLRILTRQLGIIRETNDLGVDVATRRNDEIGELSREFGGMLDQLGRNIADRQRSEERLQEAQQVARVGSWEFDIQAQSWWWSDELYRIHSRSIEEGPPPIEEIQASIHSDDQSRVETQLRSLIEGDLESAGIEARFVVGNGDIQHHHVLWNVERGTEGKPLRVYGTVSDVTKRHQAEEALRRAAAVFDTATEGILIADPAGTIIEVNAAFSNITGFSRDAVIGYKVDLLASDRHNFAFYQQAAAEFEQAGEWEGEIWIRCEDGKAIPAWVSLGRTIGKRASTEQIVAVFNDMTERKSAEELIARQATYDLLTELPNRALFLDRLSQETLRAEKDGCAVALLFIDLDGFKKVNDTIGHEAGDEVLRETAKRIKHSIRTVDTAARVGGDEFAVIVPKLHDVVDAEAVAKRVLSSMAVPMNVLGQDVLTTASIGISVFPSDSQDDTELLRAADIAMYRSKNNGGNSIEFFTSEMNDRVMRRAHVENQLRRALELEEFEIHYQPIVALPDRRMVGVEALLRWSNEELGVVSPAEFIPVAESTGLIVQIGAWVLATACRQVKEWQDGGWSDLRIAVNLSPREVDRSDAIKSISDALNKSGLAPNDLEIEVTERVLLDDVEKAASIFSKIKDLGVRLCIDDFGTGYSSLMYLRNYPFDVLKIDQTFVQDAAQHESGVSLVRAIIAMAESLDLQVIAEGIETEEQFNLLCEMGCGFAQGHYFGPPMSATQIGIGGPVVDLDSDPSATGDATRDRLQASTGDTD